MEINRYIRKDIKPVVVKIDHHKIVGVGSYSPFMNVLLKNFLYIHWFDSSLKNKF